MTRKAVSAMTAAAWRWIGRAARQPGRQEQGF